MALDERTSHLLVVQARATKAQQVAGILMISRIKQKRMVRLQLPSAERTVRHFSTDAWESRWAGTLPGVTVTLEPSSRPVLDGWTSGARPTG
jgi:hypothetical protein